MRVLSQYGMCDKKEVFKTPWLFVVAKSAVCIRIDANRSLRTMVLNIASEILSIHLFSLEMVGLLYGATNSIIRKRTRPEKKNIILICGAFSVK